MKLKLLRDVRPFGRTGEITEVSPEHSDWLISLGMAEPAEAVGEQAAEPETPKALKNLAKETPKVAKAAKAPVKKTNKK